MRTTIRVLGWVLIIGGVLLSPWTACEGYLRWVEHNGRTDFQTFMTLLQREDWAEMKRALPHGVQDLDDLKRLTKTRGPLQSWTIRKWQTDSDPTEPDQYASLTVVRGGRTYNAEFDIEGADPPGLITYGESDFTAGPEATAFE